MHLDLPPPYPARCSPDVDTARAYSTGWARRVGIVGSGDPWAEIWDEQDLTDFDFGLFAARVHPDALGARLNLIACWHTWSWYLGDLVMERFKRTRDIPGARQFLMRLGEMREGTWKPENPAERGLADLVRRTKAEPAWVERLAERMPNIVDDALWEIANLATGRVPEPLDYLAMRRRVGGALWAARLNELVLGIDIPAEIRGTTWMQRLEEAFADVVGLHNDLVSYRRETEYEQEVSNGVVVTQAFLATGLGDAVLRTHRLLDARLELFERLASVEVLVVLTDRRVRPAIAAVVARHIQGLRDWLAGDYEWHRETARYEPASWQRKSPRLPVGPSGLGTSATRPWEK
ncbi:hypothetical protein ACIOD2_47000 [Amycolatopsis sp. NPDC088138]|uniref:terpene synthase family protein n=1 Tax=Amycolatopsis sp. NPDC088138 TaxID=3363938 RepID=UPI0038057CBF